MPLRDVFERQRGAFLREAPPEHAERHDALTQLLHLVYDHRDSLADAVSSDAGHRSRHDFLITEIYTTMKAIRHARRHLRRWMRPRRVPVPLEMWPGRARVLYQPLGVVGIVGPWNYPLYLTLAPLVGALAAGNRAMLKPSEHAPRCAELLARLLATRFDEEHVAVAVGGPDVGREFSELPFDRLLFSGSTEVGRQVMRAAAGNLTPVTLELGGKSPAIIGSGAKLHSAARSILAGKLYNAGQTCIAPDYVLLPAPRRDEFVVQARQAVARLFPRIRGNPDYSSIHGERHLARLRALLADAQDKGARVLSLDPDGDTGETEASTLAPRLVLDVTDDMAVMQQEIFGPLLPLVTYRDIDGAIDYVSARPRPLALYYFGHDRVEQRRMLMRTVSGGVTINDTMYHIAVDDLPFGGVGASGMGSYHGFAGFETFSMKKPVFYQSRINGTGLFLPPYGKLTERVLRLLIGRR